MLLRTWAITRKEFIQLFRDWRTLTVVVVLPVLMLVLYGYAINMDVKHLRTAVLDQDHGAAARDLVQAFENNEYFDVVRYLDSPAQIDRALERGEARLALVIPRGYARELASGREAQIQVIIDGSDPTMASLAMGYVSGIVQSYSTEVTLAAVTRAGIARPENLQPVDYRPRVWYNPELKSAYFIVPGLIAVILMLLGALLTSMTVVRERERGTIEQLIVSPVMPQELMIGKITPYVIIAFADVILVTVAGRLLFGVPLRGSGVLLMALSALFLVAALGIGLVISTLSRSQQAAMTLAMMTTMLPSVLLSGFVFPIASMPRPIQVITYLIPARYFLVIVRGIFLKGVGAGVLWHQAVPLAVFGAVAIVSSALRFHKRL
jgi:ABC-2 type transport system permease protein